MSRILKLFSRNKKTLALVLGLGLVLSLIPLHFAQAGVWEDILEAVNYIITLPMRLSALVIAIPLALIAVGVWVLYTILTVILGWLKVIALSVPILPGEVDVVQAGWEITRNLANMGFILILVFIGLATILRIKEYEAKKLLPILIIVALLINFSPVIVGFVVDVSNIITNFFLNLGSWEHIGTTWGIIADYWGSAFSIMTKVGDFWDVIGDVIGTLVLGVVLIAFFAYSAWIYLLVTALLIVRIIVLWILMILAPLAFLLYVLPAGRKLAREWWQQLIQWSIIAIPIGFFLFLSFRVLEASTKIQIGGFFRTDTLKGEVEGAEIVGTNGIDFGNLTGELADVLGMILVPLVSIVILHIGYKLSRRYMPAAANQIIGGIEKTAKMVGSMALIAATGGAAAGLAVKGLGGMAKGAQWLETKAARLPGGKVWSKPFTKPMSWTTRGMEMVAKPYLEKQAIRLQKINVDKEIKDRGIENDLQGQVDYANSSLLTNKNKLQVYSWMAKQGTLQGTSGEEKDKAVALAENFAGDTHFKKEAGNILDALPDKMTKKIKLEYELAGIKDPGEIARITTEIQGDIDKIQDEFSIRGQSGAEDKATKILHARSLKPRDMAGVDKNSLKSEPFQLAMRKMSSAHLQALQNNFDDKTVRAVLDEGKGLNTLSNAEVEEMNTDAGNRKLFRWARETPAGKEMLNWSTRPIRRPGRPTPEPALEEKITRIQEQMTKLKTEIAKPYSALPSDERTELRKRQAEKFKELNIELTELQERQIRKGKRAAAPPSLTQLKLTLGKVLDAEKDLQTKIKKARSAGLREEEREFKASLRGHRERIKRMRKEVQEIEKIEKERKKIES